MKLIVDENIAFAEKAFSGFGQLQLVNGRLISREIVLGADALIIRSITQVNEDLLKDSKVKFVGTATIGTDHIDNDYLKSKRIFLADAKGCNADSVAEYVFAALFKIACEERISLNGKTIGVVGVGNIGSRIVRIAQSYGMNVLKNDPPLERDGVGSNYVSLDEILNADIITLHVPLTYKGPDKTFHLLSSKNLKNITPGSIIINTSRGSVIDYHALLKEMNQKNFKLIFDVWEGEPAININLLNKTKVGTAHIAGYSYEGKVNGIKMIYNSLCKFLNIEPVWQPGLSEITNNEFVMPDSNSVEERLYKLFDSIYDLKNDDKKLRDISKLKPSEQENHFDKLRKEYPIRREFSNFIVHLSERDKHLKSFLENLRFKLKVD
jgi:erythronate-4-phosphate dehydrogenase